MSHKQENEENTASFKSGALVNLVGWLVGNQNSAARSEVLQIPETTLPPATTGDSAKQGGRRA